MQQAVPARAPAHLWIVGVVATLWMAFGCYDYSMTVTRNENCGGADLSRTNFRFQKTCRACQALRRYAYLCRSAAL